MYWTWLFLCVQRLTSLTRPNKHPINTYDLCCTEDRWRHHLISRSVKKRKVDGLHKRTLHLFEFQQFQLSDFIFILSGTSKIAGNVESVCCFGFFVLFFSPPSSSALRTQRTTWWHCGLAMLCVDPLGCWIDIRRDCVSDKTRMGCYSSLSEICFFFWVSLCHWISSLC